VDPLDLTLREFLTLLVERGSPSGNDDWVNIRRDPYPWRRIVAAAERGECEVSRVGRRLLMKRSELDKFLARKGITPKNVEPKTETPPTDIEASVQRALRRNGYRA